MQTRVLFENPSEDLPASFELTDVPFFPQTQHQCGPAALATVLSYHGATTDPDALSSQVYLPKREGSLQIEITAAARGHDMLAYPLRPLLHDLLAEVAAGNPVLILQNNGFNWAPQWHYAVVVGYDFSRHVIVLRSGTTKRRLTAFDTFEATWQRSGFWALVVLPAGRVPVTAELTDYLKAAYALEETGRSRAALLAYRAATRTWPTASTAWLALGNKAYQLHSLEESVTAFVHAAGIEPGNALVWNNLAYALRDSGCRNEALRAVECARRLAPADSNIRDSAVEIMSSHPASPVVKCPVLNC